jgi:hypothetical protein
MKPQKANQSEKKSVGLSDAQQTIIVYIVAVIFEAAAVFNGMDAGKFACANTIPTNNAVYSILLALAGIVAVIIGIINAFFNAKSLRGVGLLVLFLCLVLGAYSQFVEFRICF